MVLFTASNMTSPSAAYHIQIGGTGVDASGNIIGTIVDTTTPELIVPSGTTPSYEKTSIVINSARTVAVLVQQYPFDMSGINLNMSDGTITTVFDNIYTGLNTLEFMMSRNQYYLMTSDDVKIINVDGAKLLILETTFLNQKLMNSFSFHYIRGKVRCIHRNLATIMNLTDALISVGYKKSSSVAFANNYDLQNNLPDVNRPRIQIFDVNYVANPTNNYSGSLLEDIRAINYLS